MGAGIGSGWRAAWRAVQVARRAGDPACYARVMDFRREALADLVADVRAGKLAARELVAHALERIDTLDPALNAFVAVDAERALQAAGRVDDAVARGDDPGPLA